MSEGVCIIESADHLPGTTVVEVDGAAVLLIYRRRYHDRLHESEFVTLRYQRDMALALADEICAAAMSCSESSPGKETSQCR